MVVAAAAGMQQDKQVAVMVQTLLPAYLPALSKQPVEQQQMEQLQLR
jgi:hypothetical protein